MMCVMADCLKPWKPVKKHIKACGCRQELAKYSFGEATLHLQSIDDTDCCVLNGQQRLITITILLSVLRHLASTRFPDQLEVINNELETTFFNFKQGREMREVPRMRVRALQADFWNHYISPASDNLGCFWDEDGRLLLQLAGTDTIKRRFMQVADVLKEVSLSA